MYMLGGDAGRFNQLSEPLSPFSFSPGARNLGYLDVD